MYDYEHSSELALIRRAHKGDVKAFSELYARIWLWKLPFSLWLSHNLP